MSFKKHIVEQHKIFVSLNAKKFFIFHTEMHA